MSLWINQSEKKSRTVSLWINQSEKKSRTVSLWINQSEKKIRTVSLWINQSEKKSRTVSLWINQSEMYRVNVLENVINRQGKKNRGRTVSTFIEKRDKPELKKILFYLKWRNFLSNNDVFIEEIQKVTD